MADMGQYPSDRMPGPADKRYESGWDFNDDGFDMSGVQSAATPSVGQGNQLPGDQRWELGWDFGRQMDGMASPLDTIPRANVMGVFSDGGNLLDGDVAQSAGYHIVGGSIPSNTDAVLTSQIVPAFNALEQDAGAKQGGGPIMGTDSMAGIILGPGSGPLGIPGEQSTANAGSLNQGQSGIEFPREGFFGDGTSSHERGGDGGGSSI